MQPGLHIGGISRVYPAAAFSRLVANTARQGAANTDPTVTPSINTTGATLIVVMAATFNGGIGSNMALVSDSVGGTASTTAMSITNAVQSGSNMTLTGTFAAGGSNAFVGKYISVSGYDAFGDHNNGGFLCTSSSTTTLVVTNPNGVNSVHAAFAMVSDNAWHGFRGEQFFVPNMFYCYAPTVGANHTFAMSTAAYPGGGGSIAVAAFSGTSTLADCRQPGSVFCGATNSTSLQTGQVLSASYAGGHLTVDLSNAPSVGNPLFNTAERVGRSYTLTGFTGSSAVNNGTWPCTSSNTGSLTLTVPGGFNGMAGTPVISLVPDDVDTLIVLGLSGQSFAGPTFIDSPFIMLDSYQGLALSTPISMAYYVTSNTDPQNPFWSFASATRANSIIVAFNHA